MADSRLVVRAVSGVAEWEIARAIRTQVFIEEQRTVTYERRAVAKLERIAILNEYRGHGYGRELVVRTMEDARLAGFGSFLVHAQTYLEHLYSGLGFVRVGETFVEADLPHVRMVREPV